MPELVEVGSFDERPFAHRLRWEGIRDSNYDRIK